MGNIEKLRSAVEELYSQKDPNRDDWADWLYEYHVLWVAELTREIASKYGAKADIAEAAALLHDIADARMARRNDGHEAESLRLAAEILEGCEYNEQEILLIVDDADRYHSCHSGMIPQSLEGKALATADAMAHFQTEFYAFAFYHMGNEQRRDYSEVLEWARKKIERDYHHKILFEEEKREVKEAYETLKQILNHTINIDKA